MLHHGRAGGRRHPFAREAALQIAARGGGHSYAGNSVCDGELMIHPGAMNSVAVGFGTPEAIVAPIREAVPPLFQLVTPMPYVALRQMFNDIAAWGTLGYEKALYLDELSDAAIAAISEQVPKKVSPVSFCPTFTLAGAYRTRADDDTATGLQHVTKS